MKIQFLLKFGEKENLEKLLYKGEFYAKPLIDHKKRRSKHMRDDSNEGRYAIEHLKNQSIELKINKVGAWKNLPSYNVHLDGWLDATKVHNYSLYSITEDQARENEFLPIPENMKEYGDHFLVIKNPMEFVKRVKRVLLENGFSHENGAVTYYNDAENQNSLGYFFKTMSHAPEQEYRFIIESDSPNPTILYLGNLEDISELMAVDQYLGFQFVWER